MDFDITDDMVWAAASAQYENTEGGRLEDAHPADQAMWLDDARVGLEAAKNAIAAAAIRKTEHRFRTIHGAYGVNAHTVKSFLDRVATDYEVGVTSFANRT